MRGSNGEGYVLLAVLAGGLLERLVHHADLAAIALGMAMGFVLGGLYFVRGSR